MNIDTELQDYEAAGSLAEELPYWGWLDDERSCLTRAGELMSLARISPFVLDGQTPEQLDRVIDRWQRMLSGLDARTRFYFYLLRRPIHFPEVSLTGASKVVTLGQRKRREFLTKRVQDVSPRFCPAKDPGSAAPLLLKAVLDERPRSGDGGERGGGGKCDPCLYRRVSPRAWPRSLGLLSELPRAPTRHRRDAQKRMASSPAHAARPDERIPKHLLPARCLYL